MKLVFFILNSILLVTIFSCNNNNIPNISKVKVEYKLNRFDQEFIDIDANNEKELKDQLIKKYPIFTPFYLQHIIPYDNKTNKSTDIYKYRNDSSTLAVYNIIKEEFDNFSSIKNEFNYAFKYYKYYFPNTTIPDIYTYTGGFGYQQFLFNLNKDKDGLGIGLDMFLKNRIPYKSYFPNQPQFSDYNTRTFDKNHIVEKSMNILIKDKITSKSPTTLLEGMIESGKVMYIIDHILPYASDTIITNYTSKQLSWCKNHAYELWAFYRNNDLIYTKNKKRIAQYLSPAPSSPGLDIQAPSRTGVYIGWKIVESYMNRVPNISYEELLNQKSANEILKLAKYKPRRKE